MPVGRLELLLLLLLRVIRSGRRRKEVVNELAPRPGPASAAPLINAANGRRLSLFPVPLAGRMHAD